MISPIMRKAIVVAALTLAVSGCFGRDQAVYNVTDHPITSVSKPLTLPEIQKNIILAGSARAWHFTPVQPGYLKGHLDDRGHSADVDVRFSTTSYSISYADSSNLRATADGEIHRSYNHWIRNLEKDIDVQLTKASAQ